MEELRERFDAELRPTPAGWKGYAGHVEKTAASAVKGTVFAPELVVLRCLGGSRPLGLESTLLLTEALRGTAMKSCPDPPPEWVSGHRGPQGPPSRNPHIAFAPLGHVGREHADGHLLGIALAVPKGVSDAEQRDCLSPLLFDEGGLPREIRVTLGRAGVWNIGIDDREDRPWTLRPETWTSDRFGGCETWATVTPIVLDRYPKDRNPVRRADRIEEIVAESCARIFDPHTVAGTQAPHVRKVIATPAPLFAGVPHSRDFPPFCSGPSQARRFHTHALIVLSESVVGPVLIGAGRYRGYGLCRPWQEARG